MKRSVLQLTALVIGLSGASQAQTAVDLRTQSRNVDFSGAASTKPFKTGTALPSKCAVGETFFKTDAPAGQGLYACGPEADNWVLVGGSAWASLPPGVQGQVLTSTGTTAEWRSVGGDVGGAPDSMKVEKLQGRSISGNTPADGNVLQWNNTTSQWEPAESVPLSGGEGIAISGATIGI